MSVLIVRDKHFHTRVDAVQKLLFLLTAVKLQNPPWRLVRFGAAQVFLNSSACSSDPTFRQPDRFYNVTLDPQPGTIVRLFDTLYRLPTEHSKSDSATADDCFESNRT